MGTNVDDLVVLTLFFLSARAVGKPRRWQIWLGRYAGIAVLVLVSAVAALGLTVVPDRWVGLLGLVPCALGVRGLGSAFRSRGKDEPPAPVVGTGLLSVAAVTVTNGADNISVYTRRSGPSGSPTACSRSRSSASASPPGVWPVAGSAHTRRPSPWYAAAGTGSSRSSSS
ncbi:cadmium resistance transporter [Plantactinospora sp. WMMB782]|uniref:cadmium resistance transporter n=1 Tax=Plantactinospora sp. WMMB782 TaxID=3404121 RepID=UPI003B94925D